MFIRKHGRRYLILHSYRDGRGKVCQRRLGYFLDAAGLQRQLAELPVRCPDLADGLDGLRNRGQAILGDGSPCEAAPQRAQRIRRAARLLSTYLAEESEPEVWRECNDELAALRSKLPAAEMDEVERARGRLSPRRRRFDPSEVEAQPYREALDKRAAELAQEGRLAESAEVLSERIQRCPTSAARRPMARCCIDWGG